MLGIHIGFKSTVLTYGLLLNYAIFRAGTSELFDQSCSYANTECVAPLRIFVRKMFLLQTKLLLQYSQYLISFAEL